MAAGGITKAQIVHSDVSHSGTQFSMAQELTRSLERFLGGYASGRGMPQLSGHPHRHMIGRQSLGVVCQARAADGLAVAVTIVDFTDLGTYLSFDAAANRPAGGPGRGTQSGKAGTFGTPGRKHHGAGVEWFKPAGSLELEPKHRAAVWAQVNAAGPAVMFGFVGIIRHQIHQHLRRCTLEFQRRHSPACFMLQVLQAHGQQFAHAATCERVQLHGPGHGGRQKWQHAPHVLKRDRRHVLIFTRREHAGGDGTAAAKGRDGHQRAVHVFRHQFLGHAPAKHGADVLHVRVDSGAGPKPAGVSGKPSLESRQRFGAKRLDRKIIETGAAQ